MKLCCLRVSYLIETYKPNASVYCSGCCDGLVSVWVLNQLTGSESNLSPFNYQSDTILEVSWYRQQTIFLKIAKYLQSIYKENLCTLTLKQKLQIHVIRQCFIMCFITFVNVDQEDEEFYNPVTSVGAFLTVQGHVSTVTSLVFCPSGLMLASGCDRGWLNIWSICVSVLFYLTYYFTELLFFFHSGYHFCGV